MSSNSREAILTAARSAAQSHGYSGLNFRDLAEDVGIKSASIYYHFPSKAISAQRSQSATGRTRRSPWRPCWPKPQICCAACTNIQRYFANRLRVKTACVSAASWPLNTMTCRKR